jgi:TolA-binding protein
MSASRSASASKPRPRNISKPQRNKNTETGRSRSVSLNVTNKFDPHEKVIRELMAQNDSLKKQLKKCNDEKEELEKINDGHKNTETNNREARESMKRLDKMLQKKTKKRFTLKIPMERYSREPIVPNVPNVTPKHKNLTFEEMMKLPMHYGTKIKPNDNTRRDTTRRAYHKAENVLP